MVVEIDDEVAVVEARHAWVMDVMAIYVGRLFHDDVILRHWRDVGICSNLICRYALCFYYLSGELTTPRCVCYQTKSASLDYLPSRELSLFSFDFHACDYFGCACVLLAA